MNKEIKYLLEEIKDNTQDYVGTNGCLYQDLLREELNLLLDYISNLQNQVKKQKEAIDKAIEYINENKDKYYQDWGQDDSSYDTYLGEYEIEKLLGILKEESE